MANRQTVVVAGSGGCGKSALTIHFVAGQFCEEYDPTIEDCYNRTLEVDNVPVKLEILDTAGQEELSTLRESWYSRASAFIVVFSLTDMATLQEAKFFRQEICRVADSREVKPIMLLCGTKADMEKSRQVSHSEAHSLAKSWKCKYIETSAKTGTNVTETFAQIVRAIRVSQRDEERTFKKLKGKPPACMLF